MQLLQIHLVSSLRAGFPVPTSSSLRLRRLFLCTAAASPAGFIAESYLVANCGLTPSQALKASKCLSHIKSTDQPDAVLAFLAGINLSRSDVATTISRRPRFLCSDVDGTLAPRVAELRGIGLSDAQIARLVPLVPSVFASPAHVSRLAFYVSFLGSFDKVLAAIKRNSSLLGRSIEGGVKPNIELLRQCGLPARDIAEVLVQAPRLLAGSRERLEAVIERAEELGVPRGTPMFRYALVVAYSVGRETSTAKMELLKSLGWSSAQVAMAVAKMPYVLASSEDRLRRALDFLTKEAGMEVDYIARVPSLLKFSIETRLAPRLKVLKLLKEKGLSVGDRSFYGAACMSNENFLKTFVRPHEKNLPAGIADAFAAAPAGKARGKAAS